MTEALTTTITVNGQHRTVSPGSTVTDLVTEITGRPIAEDGRATDGSRLGVAVARNAEVVPRSQWWCTGLRHGDDIEIVTAVQGG
ncbi:sulfur carrier protein ThiS [Cryobacterium sp. PH29-G1]|uniref:sulfur carrier protein ThiS n=1 Tax=Cryobacterium sp. PH29-G1 TaxID=3046211 RepID=UPI0024BA7D46|nr:sulfur carrier protein ThiS [Cryobacterium sp. PH29-G1]MDJ0350880.1 sulfur carrier protein ThiS [Cryobacterium sp. PH29-G1]